MWAGRTSERTVTFGKVVVGVWIVFGLGELDGDFGCEVLGFSHMVARAGISVRHLERWPEVVVRRDAGSLVDLVRAVVNV